MDLSGGCRDKIAGFCLVKVGVLESVVHLVVVV